MERITTAINNISASDTPARKAWERMSRLKVPKWGDVDLDELGVYIHSGRLYKYAPADGMHRLARILDLRGACQVVFTVYRGHEGYIDSLVTLTKEDGVENLEQFLQMCKAGHFLREDTA